MSFDFSSTVDPEKLFIVNLGETSGRLDPAFHLPYFRQRSEELQNSLYTVVPLGSLDGRIFQGVGRNLVEEASTTLLKVKNIKKDGAIDFEQTEPIQKVPESKILMPGDILSPFIGAAIKGYKFAKFEGWNRPCTVDNNTGVIRITDSRTSPDFLYAFFQTDLIRWQLDQLVGGGGVPFLGSEYAGRIRVPIPSASVQERVIRRLSEGRIRKARLEEEAKSLLATIDDLLLAELGIPNPPEPPNTLVSRMFQRRFSEVSGNRFDPIANQEKRKRLEEAIHAANCPIVPLRKLIHLSKELAKEIGGGDTYLGLENISGDTGDFIPTSDKDSVSTAAKFHRGQILFPKLRPYLNKTHLAEFKGLCSTEFHVFDADGISAEYLTHFLRSRAIVGITSLLMTGNTLPRLQIEDILKLPIPQPSPEMQKAICSEISAILIQARSLRAQAQADLQHAKRDIEAMILGEPAKTLTNRTTVKAFAK